MPSEENKYKHAIDLKHQHPKSTHFLSTTRKHLKILVEENKDLNYAINPERLNFQINTFSFNETKTPDAPMRSEQPPKLCPQP